MDNRTYVHVEQVSESDSCNDVLKLADVLRNVLYTRPHGAWCRCCQHGQYSACQQFRCRQHAQYSACQQFTGSDCVHTAAV